TKQPHPSTAELTAFPISPKNWVRSRLGRRWRSRRRNRHRPSFNGLKGRLSPKRGVGREGPKNGADASRFDGRGRFLTLPSEGTGAAMAQTSTVQDTHRAVLFRSSLLCRQGMTSRTA